MRANLWYVAGMTTSTTAACPPICSIDRVIRFLSIKLPRAATTLSQATLCWFAHRKAAQAPLVSGLTPPAAALVVTPHCACVQLFSGAEGYGMVDDTCNTSGTQSGATTNTRARRRPAAVQPVPLLLHEPLYVGIDVGKASHVAGFVSATLLTRHQRFKACPTLLFTNPRAGFRALAERIRTYAPLEHVAGAVQHPGHHHQ